MQPATDPTSEYTNQQNSRTGLRGNMFQDAHLSTYIGGNLVSITGVTDK